MTARPTFDELVAAVAGMRAHQRAFFAAASGSPERHEALRASKGAEARVDAMIKAVRAEPDPQGGLFG